VNWNDINEVLAYAVANTSLSFSELLDFTPKTLSTFLKHQSIKNKIDERKQYELARFNLTYLLSPYSDKPIQINFPWDNQNSEFDENELLEKMATVKFGEKREFKTKTIFNG